MHETIRQTHKILFVYPTGMYSVAQIIERIRDETGLYDHNLPDLKLLRYINVAYGDVVRAIISTNQGYYAQHHTTNLVTGQNVYPLQAMTSTQE